MQYRQSTSELHFYAGAYHVYTGYAGAAVLPFNSRNVTLGYRSTHARNDSQWRVSQLVCVPSMETHQRFENRDELYVDYGTPAAVSTLNRAV